MFKIGRTTGIPGQLTDLELTLHSLLISLPIVPLHLLVVLQDLDELLAKQCGLPEDMSSHCFRFHTRRHCIVTYLVLPNCLILRARDGVLRQRLDLLLQAIAQLARLPDEVIQKGGILAACAVVSGVERARVQV